MLRPSLAIAVTGLLFSSAAGQSLYEMPASPVPARGEGAAVVQAPQAGESLMAVSLFAIEPPKPREFAENDLVTIIISERNKLDRTQSLETEKDYELDVTIKSFIDLLKLLETRIETGRQDILDVDVSSGQKFDGEGTYEREDKLTARVTARIVEVKPNGTLLLEARTSIVTDEEEQTIVLSGLCRAEDVTDANTVQSNQMFDLLLNIQHAGDVKRAGKKGLIPRAIETLFNF